MTTVTSLWTGFLLPFPYAVEQFFAASRSLLCTGMGKRTRRICDKPIESHIPSIDKEAQGLLLWSKGLMAYDNCCWSTVSFIYFSKEDESLLLTLMIQDQELFLS